MMDEKTVRWYFKTYKGKGINGLLRTAWIGSKSNLMQEQKTEWATYLDENLIQTTEKLE